MRGGGGQQRAIADAVTAFAASLVLGIALTTGASSMVALVAVLGGLLIPALTAVSVVRRMPLVTTPADRITLLRGVLAGGCATLVTLSLMGDVQVRSWPLFCLALPAFLLDGVDGWVARRTGTASAVGGRLDMETDAAFFLVLSIALAPSVGVWVLGIGAMRYVFWLAAAWRPALGRPLAFSHFRRVTAGLQGGVLVAVILPMIPLGVAKIATALALTLLIISFGRDIITLEASHVRPGDTPRASTGFMVTPSR